MRIIGVEEHVLDPDITAATASTLDELCPDFAAACIATGEFPPPEVAHGLGERRLADIDAGGIAMQVLSCPGAQLLSAEVAVELTSNANDKAAKAVREYPNRFAALATLPIAVPDAAAAAELSRCVSELGFVGAMLTGRTDGEFIDAPRFDPIIKCAADLDVPIYVHPAVPPEPSPMPTTRADSHRSSLRGCRPVHGDGIWKPRTTFCTWCCLGCSIDTRSCNSFSGIGGR